MANCPTDKAQFTSNESLIYTTFIGNNNSVITNSIESIKSDMSQIIKGAGIGTQTQYNNSQIKFTQLVEGLQKYSELNKCLSQYINGIVNDSSVDNKILEVGKLDDSIKTLQNNLETAKHDLEVSRTRQKNIQESEKETTLYQGFSGKIGFIRPLKKSSVPILIALGITMVLFTALLLKEFFAPTAGFANSLSGYNTSGVGSLFTNERFYSASAGFISTVIVVGILAYYGYLGTSIQ
jgi:hypothetical protein